LHVNLSQFVLSGLWMELFRKRSPSKVMLKAGIASLVIHGAIIVLFTLNPWPQWIRTQPIVYTVSLMPLVLPEPETASAYALPAPREATPKPVPKPVETKKPLDQPKKDDIVEKVKKPPQKVEKPEEHKLEKPKPEKPSADQKSLKGLQEALDDIRRKVALDNIQRRVAQREKTEKEKTVTPPQTSSAKPFTSSTASPVRTESKLNEYYSMIWAKIKEEWTIPENLLKETVDLETIIVIIIERDGKIQRSWFERRSGDVHYDQAAMRAILKADPLPPIPRELNEASLEIGIRFYPD
jgi:TonB family protein